MERGEYRIVGLERPDDGAVEGESPLPGRQQEGIAIDASGGLWIADDLDKSLLHIKEAMQALQARLAQGSDPSDEETPAAESSPKKDDIFSP